MPVMLAWGGAGGHERNVPTLYTVTANLLAETTAWYESDAPGDTHRARRESFQVGGKGINVARMASRLGLKAVALYFPAGCTGARCAEWMEKQPFASAYFPMSGETRSGWVARVEGRPETTFLGEDRPLEVEPWRRALRYLEENMRAGDALCLSGSIPGWRPELEEPLLLLVRLLLARNLVAVDTYGPPLRSLVELPLSLVKINRREFTGLAGPTTDEELPERLREWAARSPIRQWVVTDGPGRILAAEEARRVFSIRPPPIREVSATGSGDVLMAALLGGLMAGRDLEESLRWAVPAATANAAREGIADFATEALTPLPPEAVQSHE